MRTVLVLRFVLTLLVMIFCLGVLITFLFDFGIPNKILVGRLFLAYPFAFHFFANWFLSLGTTCEENEPMTLLSANTRTITRIKYTFFIHYLISICTHIHTIYSYKYNNDICTMSLMLTVSRVELHLKINITYLL